MATLLSSDLDRLFVQISVRRNIPNTVRHLPMHDLQQSLTATAAAYVISPSIMADRHQAVSFGRFETKLMLEAVGSSDGGLRQVGGEGLNLTLVGVASKLVLAIGAQEPKSMEE
ncbi:hypothetical protein ACLOJK_005158 [Asimina triloba]